MAENRKSMHPVHRSNCPINLAVEVLGDRWTLLVLRDLMFSDRRHFRALLEGSVEGISPSVLSDRLHSLVASGLLVRESCEEHRQKAMFRLTPAGADLVPVIAALGAWAAKHCDPDPELCDATMALEQGGEEAFYAFKERLLAEASAPQAAPAEAEKMTKADTDVPTA
ncbi:winged helix-turn-helix transcriptional regulator [Frigidibacter sp. ROC022]|uniref:winged helix-turn-helix transcriptional regulator n=1 Tax=Frigidibacter sp. ROC022 TaxID=2971796 RepID=UPI00215A62CA|nr:helix-turn-helix domain-containing protein [Frigidibacter sp. ROC022]MCR8725312.1 helix-turn-helix transcriptional regulator [Frigidibacter sp. ROC022]